MAAQTPEQKAAKVMTDACADSRFNEVGFAHRMHEQPYTIQQRFYNVLVAYVYTLAHDYEWGIFENDTYEIARLCKKIKDLAFADEYGTTSYPFYGDYEGENNLTEYPVA
jgi:hypothetical protein